MSRSSAQFIFSDGTVLHGEYNGTTDVMRSQMFATAEEAFLMWGRQGLFKTCSCPVEFCIAYSDYGGGFWWPARACRYHMVFRGPHQPYDDEDCLPMRADGNPCFLPAPHR